MKYAKTKLTIFIAVCVVLIIALPYLFVYCINTLFGTGIVVGWDEWVAAFLLLCMLTGWRAMS